MPIAVGLCALLVIVLMLAWFDGGREDLREIKMTLPAPPATVPESVS